MNYPFSWEYYITRINKKDRFLTRFYHYLRCRKIITILDSLFTAHVLKEALDIGCSYGWYSNILIAKGVQAVDAIDLNIYSESVIRDPKITFYNDDFLTKKFGKEYDIILAFEVYEHIPAEQRSAFLEKLISLLKPGGILVFSGPNSISFLYGSAFCISTLHRLFDNKKEVDWHYRIPFFYYNRILKRDSLTMIRWETNGVIPLYPHSIERILGMRLIQAIANIDSMLSPFLKGIGANYFCVLQKRRMF
jgi:SAM-dependent methyltransferase